MASITRTSAAIEKQEKALSAIAASWRGAHTSGDAAQANELVQQYHRVASQLQELGWTGAGLSVDAMLPNRLMPPFLRHVQRSP